MASKLCFLLLGLCALVAVIQAAPQKRSQQSETALKTFAKRSLKSKRDDEELSREEFIEFLKQLTPEDVEKLSDEEKLGIIFLIYLFEVQPHEIEKRNALVHVAKRSLMNKRDDDDDELTREEFIAFLNSLTKEDIEKLTDEEKLGLVFLIILFDVQEEEIKIQKRDGGYNFGDDYEYVAGLKQNKLSWKTIVKRSLFAKQIYHFDSDYDDDYKVEESSMAKIVKRSLSKRADDELTREEFIEFLKTLGPEDLKKLSDEEKLGLIFLIYVFEVEPHELERRSIN